MKKLKQLFRKFHNKNQGLTLVEMIVTFMLIGLFMIAASKVIANTVSVYYTAKGTANGMQVSSIIASKIRGTSSTHRVALTNVHSSPLLCSAGYRPTNLRRQNSSSFQMSAQPRNLT